MFSLFNRYCMINIDAGPCSRGRAQTQAFPLCLDESFAFQCVNLVPQGWAPSMVYWTLQWAHHPSHHAPLHTRDHTWAAMFMRSTPGCGTLAGPSLEWVAFWSPRPNGLAISPGLKRPSALGRPKMPGSGQLKRKSPAEDIWHAYTGHIPIIYDCSVNHAFQGIVWCPSHRNAYVHIGFD